MGFYFDNNSLTPSTGEGGSGTVDQTYNASSTNAQSGVAIAGAGFLRNQATGSDSIVVGENAATPYDDSDVVVLGNNATATAGTSLVLGNSTSSSGGIAIGHQSHAKANDIIIGNGCLSSAITDRVGTNPVFAVVDLYNSSDHAGFALVDLMTGKIPDNRLSSNIARTSDIPSVPTVNNATLTITQGGVSKGTFTANASSNVTIALDAGGGGGTVDQTYNASSTNAQSGVAIAGAGFLRNQAAITSTIAIGNTNTTPNSVLIGNNMNIESGGSIDVLGKFVTVDTGSNDSNDVVIGSGCNVTGSDCVVVGQNITASTNKDILLGYNYNSSYIIDRTSTNPVLAVTNTASTDYEGYALVDLQTGKIPNNRLTAFTGATSSVAGSVGAVPAPTTSDVDKYLKGDGTWATVSGGGGSVSYDNATINENSSNQLQTIGIIDQNSGNALQVWKGTEDDWNYGSGQRIYWNHYLYIDEQYQTIDQMLTFNKAAYGNGIYVAVGQMGAIYSSYDGKYWYPETSGTQADLYSVAFGQGQFIVVGEDMQQGGVILTSNNGKSWTSQTSNTNDALYSVACNEGLLGFEIIAVGASGTVITSTDGRDWASQTSGSSENLNKVAMIESGYIIVGDNDTLIFFDGNFSTNQTGNNYNWYGVAVQKEGNSETIMIAGNGAILSSDDGGTNWNFEYTGMPAAFNDITYGNGRFVAVGQMGEIVVGTNHNWFPYIAQMGFASNISFINGKYYSFSSDVHILTFNDCYITDNTIPADPTTLVIYDKPNEQSSLTCVSENSGNIVLSDGNEYTFINNIQVNASVGYEHPDYICFVDGVGVKIGCKKF